MTTTVATVAHHHAHGPANRRRRVLETAAPLFVRFPDRLADTAVVVLHDVFGLTEPVEQCCRMLAALGHLAVAPYFYYETGGREFTPTEPATAQLAWSRLVESGLRADVTGALDHLERRCGIPAASTAVLGIGAGAELATRSATPPELGPVIGAERGHGPHDEATLRRLAIEVHRALTPTHHRREQE